MGQPVYARDRLVDIRRGQRVKLLVMRLELGEVAKLCFFVSLWPLVFEEDDPAGSVAEGKMLPGVVVADSGDDILLQNPLAGSFIADELGLLVLATLTCKYLLHVPSIKLFLVAIRISTYRSNLVLRFQKLDRS